VHESVRPTLETAASPARRSRLAHLLEENGTLVLVLSAFAIALLSRLWQGLAADGWMALLSGREVVQHGLPSHDTLTVWAHGREWTDQQWLAQVALYGLDRLGGLRLAMLAHAFLAIGGLTGAAVLARRLGASARSITWICIPVLVVYYPGASVMRPQSFTYVLFVGVLSLLLRDERLSSRRVYLALPVLVLWANLHGSVVLGAALVSLYGALGILRGLTKSPRSLHRRYAILALTPWICVLASPYATSLPAYYEKVVVGGGFGSYVTEWAPTTLTLATAPLYLLIVVGGWLAGRVRERVSAFELATFVVVAALALHAVRNMVWLGLVALVVLPKLLDAVRTETADPLKLNRMLATVALAGALVTTAGVAVENNGWFLENYPPKTADSAAAAAGRDGKVFANEEFADWLVWSHPELGGRIAFDSRFELLSSSQLRSIAAFRNRIGSWRSTLEGYGVIVLDSEDEAEVKTALVRTQGARVVAARARVVVLRAR
jgi:hypothetical protein